MAEYLTGISDSEECPQFFKIYMPDHCSTQLRIPPAFIKFFEGSLPLKFILVTSARKSWEVDMNKIDDDVYFKSGWEKFVKDNLLEFGDFLIFYYNGGSKFYVSVSGKNNCLKETEVANNVSEKKPTQIQGNETNGTGKQKAFSLVDSDLTFEVTMRPTHITKGYLDLGRAFYDCLKEHGRQIAKLQHLGRTWDVKVTDCKGRGRFVYDWRSFVTENSLAVGDVCTFKMIDIQPEFYLISVSFSKRL